ncbi:MAG: rod shape-determining protein RodA [Alphaproteobacteria bacterium]|nr:rod shape-determining protein RodA [Alphaproteobacteria bacterium]
MARRPESDALNPPELTVARKIQQLNWGLIALISLVAAVGFAMLYSAANGDWSPWAHRQMIRYGIGLVLAICIALTDLRLLMKWSYVAYGLVLVMLAVVEVAGEIGMGAQRWIDFGLFQLQPSELMKITLVLALARYFHGLTHDDVARPHFLLVPLAMVAAPVVLVLRQPDLGTAGMILLGSGAIFFLAGIRIWKFVTLLVLGVASVPIAWQFLRDYQKKRILTFLDPESDPLGSGYHILQSKIALGSGGLFGKGFLQGSQSHLNFLPEKQTDFIFTMLAEEFGLVGGLGMIGLFLLVILYGFAIGLRAQSQFGRLLALGVTTTLFLYVFINIAMVMGLIPVVGVPLPLISYGGTALLTAMAAIGLMMCVYVHRDLRISRQGVVDD